MHIHPQAAAGLVKTDMALGGAVIGQGLGYAAVPLVGAALAAGGLGLVWLGNTRRRPVSISSSI